ncbi:gp436 family protein [Pasteurella multocida]
MKYCTIDDLITAFGADEIHRLIATDEEAEKAIDDAQAEIDMYLADRYTLPTQSVPKSLNRIACDIAHYYLYNSVDETSTVYLRYKQRIKQLSDVASGKLSLGLDGNNEKPSENQVVFIETGKKVFSR